MMNGTLCPIVSFVVPTLNRFPHVLRAVQSCLDAENPGITVQVVLTDSGSTDGSWEALQDRFGRDQRVIMVRSRPGSGPTENWLNGAQHVTGDYVTFVWSDDYIAPHFLAELLPELQKGTSLAVGRGAERDVDDNSPLLRRPGTEYWAIADYLAAFFYCDGRFWAVSPVTSLFSRDVFEAWKGLVQRWTSENPLRASLLWRRGIGPDLLLYLIGASRSGATVPIAKGPTAQCSGHAGSITQSSNRLPLMLGYWIAALWFLTEDGAPWNLAPKDATRFSAGMFLKGIAFAASAYAQRHTDGMPDWRLIVAELRGLMKVVARRRQLIEFVLAAISILVHRLVRKT